jgi:hypothetical protein
LHGLFAFNKLKANLVTNNNVIIAFSSSFNVITNFLYSFSTLLHIRQDELFSTFSSTMGYRQYFDFCRNLGISSGCLPCSVNSNLVTSRVSFPYLKTILVLFHFLVTFSILIVDFDYLFQSDPNSKSLSDWIFNKGKDLTYTAMGVGILLASVILRQKISLLYDKVELYLSLSNEVAMNSESKILARFTIIITIFHGTKGVIFDLYDMIWDTQKLRQVDRLIVPYKTGSVELFYFKFLFNQLFAALQLIHQGYVGLLLVLGASFISKAFDGIVQELDTQNLVSNVELLESCFCLKKKAGHPSVQSSCLKLEKRWKELAKIFKLFSVVSGVYLSILFPNTAFGFVTRLGAGIASAFTSWNWSDYGSRVFSGLVYAIRIVVIVEMGHRFKQNVSDRQIKTI